MQKLFNKILVPVNFSPGSELAVEKAIDMAGEHQCSIHLLHTVTIESFAAATLADRHLPVPPNLVDNRSELEYRLGKICAHIATTTADTVKADYTVAQGSWTEAIIDAIHSLGIDLVLAGRKENLFSKRKMMLNPDLIAERTKVPVVTIPSGKSFSKLMSILIPVTDFLPVRKIMYGIYLATYYKASIRLLAVGTDKTKETVSYYLARANQLIHEHCNIKTDMEMVVCNNTAVAVNEYAKLKSADLIIVNPRTQTKMPGFFSSLFGNILQKKAEPPVLTVAPL